MTDEEIAAIAAKHRMAKFPNLALTRESRQVAPADALRPLPPRVGGREKGKVRNAETELAGERKSYNIRSTAQERKKAMATGKALNGKPYAGNPHVRFDEGEVASCTAEASLRRVRQHRCNSGE